MRKNIRQAALKTASIAVSQFVELANGDQWRSKAGHGYYQTHDSYMPLMLSKDLVALDGVDTVEVIGNFVVNGEQYSQRRT